MVSYCFIFVCEKLWWTYILQRGGDNMATDYLSHHGIKGQKWGVRRYQNADGSLTEAGKKREYKKSLRSDKKIRRDMELEAYDSARFANAYSIKSKSYSKKYEKAISKDPTKSKLKTQRIENTKSLLDYSAKYWSDYNSENIKRVKKQVDSMMAKYSGTKIKDVNSKIKKNGIEYIKSIRSSMANANAIYDLHKSRDYQYNADIYTPIKRRYYVVPT